VGLPDPVAAAVIMQVASRLASPGSSVESYLARVRTMDVFDPWNEHWEQVFRYEMTTTDGPFRPRTSLQAVMEDTYYAWWHDPRRLWASLRMPVLLVRAARPLLPAGGGLAVSPAKRDRFASRVPQARVVEVDANHHGILTHKAMASAVLELLA
jgi:pimeloyl-ACP methyl ester carboxylesterase